MMCTLNSKSDADTLICFILSKKRSTKKSQHFKYIGIEYGGGGGASCVRKCNGWRFLNQFRHLA